MGRWRAVAATGTMLIIAAALGSGAPEAATGATLTMTGYPSFDDRDSGFDIDGTSIRDLYPGAVRRIEISFVNPQSYRIRISSVEGRLFSASRRGCAPTGSNLEVRPYHGSLPVTLRANGHAKLGYIEVHMPNSVANACQGAVFGIHLTGQASWADR